MSHNRAVIFTNGEIQNLATICVALRADDVLIAADGGARHMAALNLVPKVVIGDMDSLPARMSAELKKAGAEFIQHPVDKNETDLELALTYAAEQGFTSIMVMAPFGGRLDQTLANLALLTLPAISDCDVRMFDGRQEAFLITGHSVINGQPGDTVSLLPVGGRVEGIVTHNLKYPLKNESLDIYQSRGISNRMQTGRAEVTVAAGRLLCIHTSQSHEEIEK